MMVKIDPSPGKRSSASLLKLVLYPKSVIRSVEPALLPRSRNSRSSILALPRAKKGICPRILTMPRSRSLPRKPRNSSNKTDATIQILLARTATVRLRILHHLYGFSSVESYDTILQLGGELMDQYRANVRMLGDLSCQPCAGHSDISTRFQMSLLDALTSGPLMALYSPFGYLARANPHFYFSRKICIEAAWALPSRQLPPSTQRSTRPIRTSYDAL